MRKSYTLCAALAFAALPVGVAQAEICYRLAPFIDIVRLNVDANEGALGAAHHRLTGNWIADGSYTIPATGARELNVNSNTVRRVGLTGTNNSTLFGGNLLCGVDGIPGGAWKLQCSGAAGNFAQTGTPLTVISCTTAAPSSSSGQAAGAQ